MSGMVAPILMRQTTKEREKNKMTTTKTRPTSISDLITMEGRASTWQSFVIGGTMHIFHYNTLMAKVTPTALVQVSEGWGSMSDKCGMRKLINEATKLGLEFHKEIVD